MAARTAPVPSTRVISPSPTPAENTNNSYFAPITRSAAKRRPHHSSPSSSVIAEASDSDSSLEARARARSRSPETLKRRAAKRKDSTASASSKTSKKRSKPTSMPSSTLPSPPSEPQTNGHLAPPISSGTALWRSLSPSRSPSPLGLIPIHRSFRSIVHRHEIPRKALHVSIGFVTLHLYTRGISQHAIHPYLLGALIPIASVDYLRHTFPGLNRVYIRVLGALMREGEVDGYNGVIWYLLGAWTVLRFYPKDVGVMSVLLLSWCDTAASTMGRVWGRYTPRIRRGKSAAGTIAALITGVVTAGVFWGVVVPRWRWDEGFLFRGALALPERMGGGEGKREVGGLVALGIVSLWSGFVGAASEAVDMFGWDDNATIPILSGLGLWGFFKVFSS